jgi:hypothetical protein
MAKKKVQEFFVSMTATAVFERVVKIRAKDWEDAIRLAEELGLYGKEADNGRFDQFDFEKGHDWDAWEASQGIKKGWWGARETYTDYTKNKKEGKVVKIE